MPTDEELQMIKEYVLLPFALTVFERDKISIQESGVKYSGVYIDVIDRCMDNIVRRLTEIKGLFYKSGIKVFEKQRNKVYLITGYLCRGYESEFTLNWDHAKAEVEILMRKHIK